MSSPKTDAAFVRPPHWPADHPPVPHGKVGVLLINLGTPDALEWWAIRRYLREFLSDRRVIDINPILWKTLLYGIILNTRPAKTKRAYAKMWDYERNESPLRTFTRNQAVRLGERMSGQSHVIVDWAMRYGNPSIKSRLSALKEQGCDRLYLFALYPQYAAATTASVYDKCFDALKELRWQPAIRTAPPYHDHPAYIDALAQSVQDHLATLDWEPERVIASYHGIPKRYFLSGDPYHCHCHKTTRLLRERLGWVAEEGQPERLMTTFQSRFGPEEWLQPYTDETLEELPGHGVKKLAVIMPGFVSDCVETLEEIAIEGGDEFKEAGGTHYTTIPCLNDGPLGIDVLQAIAERDLAGWIDPQAQSQAQASPGAPAPGSAPAEAAE